MRGFQHFNHHEESHTLITHITGMSLANHSLESEGPRGHEEGGMGIEGQPMTKGFTIG